MVFYCRVIFPCLGGSTCTSLRVLMDTWVDSTFWLLHRKLPLTFAYRSLYGHVYLFLLSKYPGVEWLDQITFWETAELFAKVSVPLYTRASGGDSSRSDASSPALGMRGRLSCRHSNRCVVVSCFSFNLYFSNKD